MTFRRELLVKRLKEAKRTQESVQSISKLIIHYHENVTTSCETWLEIFQQASTESQLALWYVANEVVQTAGNKRRGLGTLFKEAFRPYLERALPLTCDKSRHAQFLKVVSVWEERKVYDAPFCGRLKNILGDSNDFDVPESGISRSMSGKNEEFIPQAFDSPLHAPEEIRTEDSQASVYDDEERIARAMNISQDFQMATTREILDKSVKAKTDAEVAKKQFEMNTFDITSMESFRALKEKSEGIKMKQQFEVVASRLEDLTKQMGMQLELQNQVLDHALAAELYFKHQQSEAIVVCKAYKNFGSRIASLRKKLREKKKTLPVVSSQHVLASSMQPPQQMSSSATAGGDMMELDNEEEDVSHIETNATSVPVYHGAQHSPFSTSHPSPGTQAYSQAAPSYSILPNPTKQPVRIEETPFGSVKLPPLEAPPDSTLTAVSDIMRQLMSRVNVPSSNPSATMTNQIHAEASPSPESLSATGGQQQLNYYGRNPLMTSSSFYTSPYSNGEVNAPPSNTQTAKIPPSSAPPLPPSDNGDGGGVTTAFFRSLASTNSPPEKPVLRATGSANPLESHIDQRIPDRDVQRSPNKSQAPVSPSKSTYQSAPSFYSPQSQSNHYAMPTVNPNQNANFAQLYPVVNPPYYPNFFNSQKQTPGGARFESGQSSAVSGDIDLRHGAPHSYIANPTPNAAFDSTSNQNRDFDARFSSSNNWNYSQQSPTNDDPRKRRGAPLQPYDSFGPKRPFRGRYNPRANFEPRGGHWANRLQLDHDYRGRPDESRGRGARGMGRWNGRFGNHGYQPRLPDSSHQVVQGAEFEKTEGDKTIKDVLRESTGVAIPEVDTGSSSDSSPQKNQGSGMWSASEIELPSSSNDQQNNQETSNLSHFEAIKRARNVAREFDASVDSIRKTPTMDDANDGSVPIVMYSDIDTSDKSESGSPLKQLRNQIEHSPRVIPVSNMGVNVSPNKGQPIRGAPPASIRVPQPNLSNIDTSSPEYARWWFYHYGRGGSRGAPNGRPNNRGASHHHLSPSIRPMQGLHN